MSSSGTSPTYSDTPLVLQAGKFVLALPLIVMSAVLWVRNSAKLTRSLIVLGTVFISVHSLFKVYQERDSQFLDLAFWLIFALVVVLAIDSVSLSAIDRYFRLLLVYSLGSTVVEVALFVIFGRLPALAFEGSYLVRFGGFLDDPNGFAAILFLLMAWSYWRFKGTSRVFVLASLVASLFLTQSWTALAFFFGLLGILALLFLKKRPLWALGTSCVLPLLVVLVAGWIRALPSGLLWDILQDKQSSIEGHTFPFADWISKWPEWLIMGEWKYNPYESWWLSSMINFGVLWFVAYFALIIALLFALWRANAKTTLEAKPVCAGILVFGLYFAFGSLNLPLPIIFPINALFFIFSFLIAFKKVAVEDRSPPSLSYGMRLSDTSPKCNRR
jgi:hypothetical protein